MSPPAYIPISPVAPVCVWCVCVWGGGGVERAYARSNVLSARPSIRSVCMIVCACVRAYVVYYINGREFLFCLTLLVTCFVLGYESLCVNARRSPYVCKHICTPAHRSVCAYVRTCLRESVLMCAYALAFVYI